MKMTNEQFDKLRFYAEIIGYVLAFILAVSDIVGFKYGSTLGAIIAAVNVLLGQIVNASRKAYLKGQEIESEAE